jgi:hypothetical protein
LETISWQLADIRIGFRKAETAEEECRPIDNGALLNFLKSVYRDRTDTRLLAECIQGTTQNDRGCSSKCILQSKPKILCVELKNLKIDVMYGVTCFNAGMKSQIKFWGKLAVKAGDDLKS